jgi:peptide/nickel transport system permease protein
MMKEMEISADIEPKAPGSRGVWILVYALGKALRLLLTVSLVAVLAFVLVHVLPGDPALVAAGIDARPSDVAAIRRAMGTDRPLGVQFAQWASGLTRLDLGNSLISKERITHLIAQRFPLTLELALLAMAFAIGIGLPLGIVSATRQGGAGDGIIAFLSRLGLSLPGFWLGIVLLLAFAVALPLFPLFGGTDFRSLVLPAVALGAANAAMLTRQTRAAMLDELSSEYVVAARAKGLSGAAVALRHALHNALPPVVTLAGMQFGALFGGAVVVEQVFSLPGLGRLTLTAVTQRDFPVVQGCVVFLAVVASVASFLADLASAIARPGAGEAGGL